MKSEADSRTLRQFGLALGTGLAVMLGLLLPWLWGSAMPLWPWLAGGSLAALGQWRPLWLRSAYRSWMPLALALGWLNTRLLLGLVFYGLLTPMGLALRCLGRDPLRRRFEPLADSYRVAATPRPDRRHFERPF